MAAYQMQISDDAYKFLVAEAIAEHAQADWMNVRSLDGSSAKLGRTVSAELFEQWKSRLSDGQFEFVVPDQ